MAIIIIIICNCIIIIITTTTTSSSSSSSCSISSSMNIIIICSLRVFNVRFSWWSYTGVRVKVSPFKSPGLFSEFCPLSIM